MSTNLGWAELRHDMNALGVTSVKKQFLVMGLLTLWCLSGAQASSVSCFSIHDPDKKNVCLAMSKKQNSYCFSVKDADTKNMCLANVMAQRSYCYSIKTNDMKQQCLAQVK